MTVPCPIEENEREESARATTAVAAATTEVEPATGLPSCPPPCKSSLSLSRPRLIWMLATGTRGDIQPFAAIGLALARHGYRVKFFTNQDFVNFVSSFGLEGIALRPSNRDVGHRDDPNRPLQSLIETNAKGAPASADIIRSELSKEKPDLVIASAMLTGIAWFLSVRHNVPHMDLTPVADIELPKLPFNLQDQLFGRQVYKIFQPFLRELDPDLEQMIPPGTYCRLRKNPNRPVYVMQSPTIARVQYAHLTSPLYRYIGTTVIEESDETRASTTLSPRTSDDDNDDEAAAASFGGVGSETMRRLREFLDRPGTTPIYMGWGSMKSRSPEHLVELCVRAARGCGRRAIVLEGDAGLSREALERAVPSDTDDLLAYARDNVLFVQSAPHEWLFPKVAAIVHHGGAGTTTASLRAGVPSVIAPVLADQFDHSRLLNQLGVGVGLSKQINSVTWQELSDAIRRAVEDGGVRANASALSRQLLSERNGADVAVEEVEAFWTEYWLSGKFHECFPPRPARKSAFPLGSTPILAGCVVISVVAVATWFISLHGL